MTTLVTQVYFYKTFCMFLVYQVFRKYTCVAWPRNIFNEWAQFLIFNMHSSWWSCKLLNIPLIISKNHLSTILFLWQRRHINFESINCEKGCEVRAVGEKKYNHQICEAGDILQVRNGASGCFLTSRSTTTALLQHMPSSKVYVCGGKKISIFTLAHVTYAPLFFISLPTCHLTLSSSFVVLCCGFKVNTFLSCCGM